ncbi:hypothetical protein DPMN_191550 [Dreissena polymorpha]|uniref:Uncharacterized protein n=1 Tax=Dreissena polymorpha TaxID=45954 RepID=A0A9D4BED5_DREPO|nr:hypothetical protein DPMN_191550 [Dreissena polymorpha]
MSEPSHCLGDLSAPSLTAMECLAPSKTVSETLWHRGRLMGLCGYVRDFLGNLLAPSFLFVNVWQRRTLSGKSLGNVVVWLLLVDLMAPS